MKKVALCIIAVVFAVVTMAIAAETGDFLKEKLTQKIVQMAARESARMIKSHSRDSDQEDDAIKTYNVILMSWGEVIQGHWGETYGFQKMTCARKPDCHWQMITEDEKGKMRGWRDSLFTDARAYLKNPDSLWQIYKVYKLAIIAGIEEADSRKAMRAYLTVVVKYFDPNSNARKEMPAHLAKYKKLTGKGEIAPDWYAYEFSQRRFKEGGNDLLKMYVQIIKDLAESLE